MSQTKKLVLKLTTSEIVIGELITSSNETIKIKYPYTVINQKLMPYEFLSLMEPIRDITLRMYDVMWNLDLKNFPELETQYIKVITPKSSIVQPEKKIII